MQKLIEKSMFHNFMKPHHEKPDSVELEKRKKAQEYLKDKKYNYFLRMTQTGYKPTNRQWAKFNAYFDKLCNDMTSLEEINMLLYCGATLKEKYIYEILLSKYIGARQLFEKTKHLEKLREEINHIIENPNFSLNILAYMKETIRTDNLKTINYKLSVLLFKWVMVSGFKKNIQLKDITDLKECLLKRTSIMKVLLSCSFSGESYYCGFKNAKLIREDVRYEIKKIIKNDFKENETYIKEVNENNIIKSPEITTSTQIKYDEPPKTPSIKKNSYVVLPEEINNKIKEINFIYEKMKINNFECGFDIENIKAKRIPETIEKYLLIPLEYRHSMKHGMSGKTATEITLQTLENYHLKFLQALDESVQKQLSALSIDKKYSEMLMPQKELT